MQVCLLTLIAHHGQQLPRFPDAACLGFRVSIMGSNCSVSLMQPTVPVCKHDTSFSHLFWCFESMQAGRKPPKQQIRKGQQQQQRL